MDPVVQRQATAAQTSPAAQSQQQPQPHLPREPNTPKEYSVSGALRKAHTLRNTPQITGALILWFKEYSVGEIGFLGT